MSSDLLSSEMRYRQHIETEGHGIEPPSFI